ncbi:hypothetical protein [Mycobacterium sp.]|uniref:hypothetical protein n=1 Tax=Mycobacterium sp. TaxID=1785 RepID=UPI0031DA0BA6
MVKAQELSTRYSIDFVAARAWAAFKKHASQPLTCQAVTIGPPGERGLACSVELCCEIARANNLKCDIAFNSTEVVLFGFQEDIDLTLKLSGSLLTQMVTASENYLATGEYKSEPVWHEVAKTVDYGHGYDRRYKKWELSPLSKVTARINFQEAYASQIGNRLSDTKAATEVEVESEHPGTALV